MTFTRRADPGFGPASSPRSLLPARFNATGASGATPAKVSGSTALALAGVIAPLSPDLTGAERKAVAMLFAANAEIPYKKPIVVTVDRIVCRTGNVDITLRNCELTFGKKSRTVNGSTANEIFATEALAGIPPDGAAGSNFESLSKLSCTSSTPMPSVARMERSRLHVPAGELNRAWARTWARNRVP